MIPLTTGLLCTVSSYGLLAPVVFAKTSGAPSLTINSNTGAISTTAAATAASVQTFGGTVTGADGVVVPFAAALTGIGTSNAPAAAFTMTQLPKANQVYQRTSLTGGGQGVGQGTITVSTTVTTAGSLYARRRSVDGSNTILQASWLVYSSVSTGSNPIPITGIDVPALASASAPVNTNDGTFYLDLSGDGVTWTNGTTAVLMGDCTFAWGQSQLVNMFKPYADGLSLSGTINGINATFGVNGITDSINSTNLYITVNGVAQSYGTNYTISGYNVVFATGSIPASGAALVIAYAISGPISSFGFCYAYANWIAGNITPTSWQLPSNSGSYNGSGCTEYLRLMVLSNGCAQGLAAYSVYGAQASYFASGTGAAGISTYMAAAGGNFRFHFSQEGGTDAQINTTAAAFTTALNTVWSAVKAANSYSNPTIVVGGPIGVCSSYTGDWLQCNTIVGAAETWAANNGAAFYNPMGLMTSSHDATHETNATGGGDYLARMIWRAFRPALGLSGTNKTALTVSSVSRSGAVITLTMSGPVATNTGNVWRRCRVFDQDSGTTDLQAIRALVSSSASGSTITLTMASDPGPGWVGSLYMMANGYSQIGVSSNNYAPDTLYDTQVYSDETALGITVAREIDFASYAQSYLTVPAVTTGGAINTLPRYNLALTSAAYSADASGFQANELSAGHGLTASPALIAQPYGSTFEFRFSVATAPAADATLCCPPRGDYFFKINSSGQLTMGKGSYVISSTNFATTGAHHHVRMVEDSAGQHCFVDGVLTTTLAFTACRMESLVGIFETSYGAYPNPYSGFTLSNVALFDYAMSTSTFTPPTAPYVGNETGLVAYYPLNGDALDHCTNTI